MGLSQNLLLYFATDGNSRECSISFDNMLSETQELLKPHCRMFNELQRHGNVVTDDASMQSSQYLAFLLERLKEISTLGFESYEYLLLKSLLSCLHSEKAFLDCVAHSVDAVTYQLQKNFHNLWEHCGTTTVAHCLHDDETKTNTNTDSTMHYLENSNYLNSALHHLIHFHIMSKQTYYPNYKPSIAQLFDSTKKISITVIATLLERVDILHGIAAFITDSDSKNILENAELAR